MYRITILSLVFLFVLIFCLKPVFAKNKNYVTIIDWHNKSNHLALKYLKLKKVNLKINKNSSITIYNKVETRNALIEFLNILNTQIIITKENIFNINTTRTAKGGAYKRKYITFNNKGIMKIVTDKKAFRLKYDPTHPDSIEKGPKKGYVELPKIDAACEFKILINSINLYNQILHILKTFDPTIIALDKSLKDVELTKIIYLENNDIIRNEILYNSLKDK
jgi:flagellar basal body rod protein FlgC